MAMNEYDINLVTQAKTTATAGGLSAGIKGLIITAAAVFCIGLGFGTALIADNFIFNNDTQIHEPNGSDPTYITEPNDIPETLPEPALTRDPESTLDPNPILDPVDAEEDIMVLGMDIVGSWVFSEFSYHRIEINFAGDTFIYSVFSENRLVEDAIGTYFISDQNITLTETEYFHATDGDADSIMGPGMFGSSETFPFRIDGDSLEIGELTFQRVR